MWHENSIDMNIFETLNKLINEEHNTKRKEPSYIYLDEKDNQIKEIPLSKLDSSASALINKTVKQYKNPAKEIHDSLSSKHDGIR
jgi:hypothetical protein